MRSSSRVSPVQNVQMLVKNNEIYTGINAKYVDQLYHLYFRCCDLKGHAGLIAALIFSQLRRIWLFPSQSSTDVDVDAQWSEQQRSGVGPAARRSLF